MLIRFEVPAHDEGIYFELRDINGVAWSTEEKLTYVITYQGRMCPVRGTTREVAARITAASRQDAMGLEDSDDSDE